MELSVRYDVLKEQILICVLPFILHMYLYKIIYSLAYTRAQSILLVDLLWECKMAKSCYHVLSGIYLSRLGEDGFTLQSYIKQNRIYY